jgi:hypothetical protein
MPKALINDMCFPLGNDVESLSLRIYLVDFAMNVLPVASISAIKAGTGSGSIKAGSDDGGGGHGSVVRTSYPGTLLLGQKPGYCEQDYDEKKCSPAIWLLNTMRFSMPGQYAINTRERTLYYWPTLASGCEKRISLAPFYAKMII